MRLRTTFCILAAAPASVLIQALTNVTIDDTRGDELTGALPTYASVNAWNARSASNPCTVCGANPDPLRALDETWYVNRLRPICFTGQ